MTKKGHTIIKKGRPIGKKGHEFIEKGRFD